MIKKRHPPDSIYPKVPIEDANLKQIQERQRNAATITRMLFLQDCGGIEHTFGTCNFCRQFKGNLSEQYLDQLTNEHFQQMCIKVNPKQHENVNIKITLHLTEDIIYTIKCMLDKSFMAINHAVHNPEMEHEVLACCWQLIKFVRHYFQDRNVDWQCYCKFIAHYCSVLNFFLQSHKHYELTIQKLKDVIVNCTNDVNKKYLAMYLMTIGTIVEVKVLYKIAHLKLPPDDISGCIRQHEEQKILEFMNSRAIQQGKFQTWMKHKQSEPFVIQPRLDQPLTMLPPFRPVLNESNCNCPTGLLQNPPRHFYPSKQQSVMENVPKCFAPHPPPVAQRMVNQHLNTSHFVRDEFRLSNRPPNIHTFSHDKRRSNQELHNQVLTPNQKLQHYQSLSRISSVMRHRNAQELSTYLKKNICSNIQPGVQQFPKIADLGIAPAPYLQEASCSYGARSTAETLRKRSLSNEQQLIAPDAKVSNECYEMPKLHKRPLNSLGGTNVPEKKSRQNSIDTPCANKQEGNESAEKGGPGNELKHMQNLIDQLHSSEKFTITPIPLEPEKAGTGNEKSSGKLHEDSRPGNQKLLDKNCAEESQLDYRLSITGASNSSGVSRLDNQSSNPDDSKSPQDCILDDKWSRYTHFLAELTLPDAALHEKTSRSNKLKSSAPSKKLPDSKNVLNAPIIISAVKPKLSVPHLGNEKLSNNHVDGSNYLSDTTSLGNSGLVHGNSRTIIKKIPLETSQSTIKLADEIKSFCSKDESNKLRVRKSCIEEVRNDKGVEITSNTPLKSDQCLKAPNRNESVIKTLTIDKHCSELGPNKAMKLLPHQQESTPSCLEKEKSETKFCSHKQNTVLAPHDLCYAHPTSAARNSPDIDFRVPDKKIVYDLYDQSPDGIESTIEVCLADGFYKHGDVRTLLNTNYLELVYSRLAMKDYVHIHGKPKDLRLRYHYQDLEYFLLHGIVNNYDVSTAIAVYFFIVCHKCGLALSRDVLDYRCNFMGREEFEAELKLLESECTIPSLVMDFYEFINRFKGEIGMEMISFEYFLDNLWSGDLIDYYYEFFLYTASFYGN